MTVYEWLVVLGALAIVAIIILEAVLRWFFWRDVTDLHKATLLNVQTVITASIQAGLHERTEALRTVTALATIDEVTDYINRGKYYDILETQISTTALEKKITQS